MIMPKEEYDLKANHRETFEISQNTFLPKRIQEYKVYGLLFGVVFVFSIAGFYFGYPRSLILETDPLTTEATVSNPNFFNVKFNDIKVEVLIGDNYTNRIGSISGNKIIPPRSSIQSNFDQEFDVISPSNSASNSSTNENPKEIKEIIAEECKKNKDSKVDYGLKYTINSVMWSGYLPSNSVIIETDSFDCSSGDEIPNELSSTIKLKEIKKDNSKDEI